VLVVCIAFFVFDFFAFDFFVFDFFNFFGFLICFVEDRTTLIMVSAWGKTTSVGVTLTVDNDLSSILP